MKNRIDLLVAFLESQEKLAEKKQDEYRTCRTNHETLRDDPDNENTTYHEIQVHENKEKEDRATGEKWGLQLAIDAINAAFEEE